jgi:nitrogen fixation protein
MEQVNINVTKVEQDVTINATPNVTQIIVTTQNGGGTQNLNNVLSEGNETDGENIFISDGDEITFDNGSRIRKGLTDAGNGGAKGVALVCSLDYELKWEAGRQYVTQQDGFTIREVSHNFTITPSATDDSTKGFAIDSRWILDNGDIYVCTDATEDSAVWELQVTQVNSDWNATSGVAEILNKPTIPDVTGFVPYTGANANVDLGEYELKAGQIELDTTPTGTAGVAVTRWNDTIGSSETTLKGGNVILKNGVDLVARIVNKVTPNTTLTKASYQVVRISGAQGQRLAVNLAQANNDNNSADTLGVVCETIATNQEGFIMTVGQLENINTTGSLQGETWSDGDVLYLSPTTAGRLTNVKPIAPAHIVIVGYVEYAHANNGKIYVKIMNGWELDELHNVAISTPLNNQGLIYETSTDLWKNKTIIEDSITNGVTTIAPSQNAVFDALALKQNSLGFTPENVDNKSTTLDSDKLSNIKYPSVKSVFDWAVGLFTQSYIIERLTTAQRDAIVSPAVGLQIFNTTEGYLEYFDSFWGWMPIDNSNEWKRKNGTEYFNDFGNNNTFSDGVFQLSPQNGGGSLSSIGAPNTNDYIGFQGLSTGVNINGGNSIRTDLSAGRFFNFNCGRKSFISRIWVANLSDVTNRYNILNGFSNSATSTLNNGAVFIYDEGGVGTGTTASPNWQIITANGGVRTNFVTSVPVNITTWYSFRIETNENDTEVYYYINDVLVRTETTNIPVSSNNAQPIIAINKNTGTTSRGIAVDYLGLKIKLNNQR